MKPYARWMIAGLLAVAGCRTGPDAPLRGQADVDEGYGVILSQAEGDRLRHDTAFQQEKVARDPFGLLHVNVPMRSITDRTEYLEYQYSFFDGTGTLIEGPMGWTRVTLEAGAPGNIQVASTSPKATQYQIVVRTQR